MSIKIERLNSLFVKEISYILQNEVKDQNIKFVTVTDCEITSDLSFAKVYVTVFDKEKEKETMKALEGAKSFIRGQLSQRVEIRHTPELRFIFDKSIEYGNKIEKLINDIHEKNA
jgi:ribosome-binding factor A